MSTFSNIAYSAAAFQDQQGLAELDGLLVGDQDLRQPVRHGAGIGFMTFIASMISSV